MNNKVAVTGANHIDPLMWLAEPEDMPDDLFAALVLLYASMYHVRKGEELDWFRAAPSSVLKAYMGIQAHLRPCPTEENR